jgi:tetratricopeptide (TPR) repeat protein
MFHLDRFKEAAEYYETLLQEEDRKSFFRYRLAKCLYDLEKYAEAKNILSNLQKIDDVWPMRSDIMPEWEKPGFHYYYPRIYHLLGLVNEKLGEKEEAMEAYWKFLDIWEEADEDLPEFIDAKERLVKLTSEI